MVADLLAKDSLTNSHGSVFFRNPPGHMSAAVLDDIAGVERARSFGLSPSS